MPEDIGPVLNQIAGLLTRLADQNDVRQKRAEEFESRNKGRSEEFQKRMESVQRNRPDFTLQRAEMKERLEESRALQARIRVEDVEFRDRLLNEMERHNRLLEKLIERLSDIRQP
jgi:leucyl aminopeptidase (aminopeptidase T)